MSRVLAAVLFVVIVLSAGVARLELSADYRMFFSPTDERLALLDQLEGTFSKTDNVVFVVHAREGDVFTPGVATALQDLTEAAWTLPHVRRVDSLTNLPHGHLEGDEVLIEPVLRADGDMAVARSRAMAEPMLVGSLLGPDGRTAGVVATLDLDPTDPLQVTATAEVARALRAEAAAAHPELDVRLSGLAMMNDALMQATVADISWSIPVMAVVMVLGMLLLLRSRAATAGILAVVGLSSAAALGTAGWLGYPLTPISASAPTIILTLCIADGVHIFLGVRHGLQDGLDLDAAIAQSLRHNLAPVTWTSLSTMVGFAALNFGESPPFSHMANTTVVGVAAAWALSLTLLPVFLRRWPPTVVPRSATRRDPWGVFAAGLQRGRGWVVAAAVVLVAGLGAAATTLENDDQFLQYFDESVAFRADTEFMVQELAGIYVMDYRLGAGEPGAVADPAYLERLAAFGDWLRAQPEVTHVHSVADLVLNLSGAFGGERTIPASRELAAQVLLAYEMSLPRGLELTDRIDLDRASTRLTVVVRDVSSQQLQRLADRSEAWLRRNTPPEMHASAISPPVLFSHLSEDNGRAMILGNLASLALISLGMVVALRSPRLGLLSMIPNLVPIVLAYGIWALVFHRINIVSSVAVAVCLGILVDDTIHFLARYQLNRRTLSPRDALAETLRTVGTALVLTSAVLVAGFAVLTQSAFQINSVFGTLVIGVVVLGLVADLVVLPACLAILDEPADAPSPEPEPSWAL